MPPTPGSSFERLVRGETIVHIADIKDDEAYRSGLRGRVAMVDVGGARTGPLGAYDSHRQDLARFIPT
jgi:hypothetical protein